MMMMLLLLRVGEMRGGAYTYNSSFFFYAERGGCSGCCTLRHVFSSIFFFAFHGPRLMDRAGLALFYFLLLFIVYTAG